MNDIEIKNPQDVARKWLEAISERREDAAEKSWTQRSKKIIKRYRDDRSDREAGSKFNILWSNIETILPATYARTPKASVSRRNKDGDPISRTASQILERALQYEIDEYPDFDETMRLAVLDRLLPGRGTAWVRFETYEISRPEEDTVPQNTAEIGQFAAEQTPATPDILERACVDYVYWEDFAHSDGRTWSDVSWVARRVYLTRKEGVARFDKGFMNVPLRKWSSGVDDEDKSSNAENGRAEVWEVWDKETKAVYWVAKGHSELLDAKLDPYGLEGFFPCPKPLYATQTSDQLTPIPDYVLYQDQAIELDKVTTRITGLVEALRLVGAYDGSQPSLARILESEDNTLVPVENWGALSERGGVSGAISFVPVKEVAMALREAYTAREQTKQVIYEITGLSDIIRGATKASETATAQNIKRQFGSLRLETRQHQIAVFATELIKIKAEMMMDLYSPETLVAMSGIDSTLDAQYIPEAISLMKSEPLRSYQIEIAADSLIALDEEQEKDDAVEFLSSAGSFLEKAVQASQVVPELGPLMMELLLMGVRSFKAGRSVEAAFDQFKQQIEQNLQQPQQEESGPDPVEMAKLEQKQQADQQKIQAQMQMDQAKLMLERERIQMQSQLEQQRAQMQAQVDAQRAQLEAQAQQQQEMAKLEFERWKTELQEATKIQVAQMQAAAKGVMQVNAATQAAGNEIVREIRQ